MIEINTFRLYIVKLKFYIPMKKLLFYISILLLASCNSGTKVTNKSTIDEMMQSFVQNELTVTMDSLEASAGAIALMEIASGRMLAWVDLSCSENNSYTEGHLLTTADEPGSLFIPVSMMIALEANKDIPDDSTDTGNGVWEVEGITIRDNNWSRGGFGQISNRQVISLSSNVGISKIIYKTYSDKPEKFFEKLREMNLNDTSISNAWGELIELPETGSKITSSDLLNASYGYGFQIKPVALLGLYSAIANNGIFSLPSSDFKSDNPTAISLKINNKDSLDFLFDCLINVVNEGTGKAALSSSISIAGKTGSVLKHAKTTKNQINTASFCGIFPAENPQYCCLAIIHQTNNDFPSGGRMAGKLVKLIAEKMTHITN